MGNRISASPRIGSPIRPIIFDPRRLHPAATDPPVPASAAAGAFPSVQLKLASEVLQESQHLLQGLRTLWALA